MIYLAELTKQGDRVYKMLDSCDAFDLDGSMMDTRLVCKTYLALQIMAEHGCLVEFSVDEVIWEPADAAKALTPVLNEMGQLRGGDDNIWEDPLEPKDLEDLIDWEWICVMEDYSDDTLQD